jgi:hypothetical protein
MDRDEALTDRVRSRLAGQRELTEGRVFGGVGFFVQGRMAVAVLGGAICIHLEGLPPTDLESREPEPLLFAGRPVQGWVSIPAEGLDDEALGKWVAKGLDAVSSPM